jgi:hypothetical protein
MSGRARRALVIVTSGVLFVSCTDNDGSLRFTNDTDDTVWVAYSASVGSELDLGTDGWTEAPAHEDVVYSIHGCLEFGEVVVATEPDAASILDRRSVTGPDEALCSDWTWSGVGDHR